MTTTLITPTESEEQQTLFEWAAHNIYRYPVLFLLHAIPNGGKRSKATAGRLKVEGVKRGVPDTCLPVARNGYHGLYIELKRRQGGRPTKEQIDWIIRLQEQGYKANICLGWEEARDVILDYLKEV